ncbi:hypothetical protein AMTRI_Chr13g116440 [Amborella trichopoda]|uniref:uncharacterized protein LOC18428832 isoform X2 n=2 Tax=Amborella trichopoda TaxID=13333 RepID=UPI0005D46626|nr:uncharacterized protein LOC18428832 isoform X2 [Amborella trichopoda]XP_011621376.1 uncharacterized protein LOC18428832 isoform X2 [Amborella trichopoda]XP_020519646.1 uncharacterized protein LOC18428832 isoform X2 [Amborella trichopoda]|eukprot:XP_011621375.1 uncharacterized protein LOC18428832 isoform X2 [Amborella trichopoda]
MASRYKFFARATVSSIKSATKSKAFSAPIQSSSSPLGVPRTSHSSSSTVSRRRLLNSRIPAQLGCTMSMLPLHSTVSAARLTSCLSMDSRSCRALSQGTLCSTPPGL